LKLFQRLIFVVLFVASFSQATAAAMMPLMNSSANSTMSMTAEASAHCDMMAMTDMSMMECHAGDNDCSEDCNCCPGACTSIYIISNNGVGLGRAQPIHLDALRVVAISAQTSLYRPPISA